MHHVTNRAAHLALAASLLAATAAHAVPMPAFDDPKLADWARQANAEMDRYLANPEAYFALPAQAAATCELPPEVMSRILGVRLPGVPMSDEEQRATARVLRGMSGMKPSENADVVVRPMKAECRDGKPAGTWAGWVEYTMVNNGPGMVIRTRMRKYLEAAVGPDGQRTGLALERQTQVSTSTDWADPATADLMRKNPPPASTTATFTFTEPQGDMVRSLTLSRVAVAGPHGGVDVSTTVTTPTGPQRLRQVTWNGTQKSAEFGMRNGRPHGLQTLYAHRNGMGLSIPGSTICWENGEQIKTTQCAAD